MDMCPKCNEYTMDYDIFKGRAICTYNGCGFKKTMSEDNYIIHYADITKYVVIPSKLEVRVKKIK